MWISPLDALYAVLHAGYDNVVLLYSGLKTGYSGRYSYLAFSSDKEIKGNDISLLDKCYYESELPRWFGTIHYETLGENVTSRSSTISTPAIYFCHYHYVIQFDHEQHILSGDYHALPPIFTKTDISYPDVSTCHALMDKQSYIDNVKDALHHIHAGNVYQVNLTRKYIGMFESAISAIDAYFMYYTLCEISPAPYSSFLWRERQAVLSSSPELFIQVDKDGIITSRPIKGTASRKHDARALQRSVKDRAENLMIVDLMRNDLARCAQPGSVDVTKLFEVDSFSTLHHLSSSITAQLQSNITLSDILRATFPPGSMTGAPKYSAMEWIAEKEKVQRGIYSGAIGWINGTQCDLSVVIRTLIAQGKIFEFQVGGGIVADSDPENEYQEILTKSKALATMLRINMPQ